MMSILLVLQPGNNLIWLAVVFLVLALVAYIMGARGTLGFSMEIARWLVIIFVILAIIVFLFGGPVVGENEQTNATPSQAVTVTPVPTLPGLVIRNATVIVSNTTVVVDGGMLYAGG